LGGEESRQLEMVLEFGTQIDRIYFDVPTELALWTGTGRLRLRQSGFRDTVVWNPGAVKASGLEDLAAGSWPRFVCIEATTIGEPVRLSAVDRWVGRQRLITGESK
jgi:D-hexose-6-phosphate mutarotase